MRNHAPVKAQIDGLERFLHLEPRSRVLDLGCGSGRRTLEISRRGHRVLGQEPDGKSLAEARSAAAGEKLNIHFHKAGLSALSYRAEFDAVLFLGGAFGRLLPEREAARALEAVRKALKPGGQLLIDALNREWLLRHFEPNMWEPSDEGKGVVLDDVVFDLESGRLDNRRVSVGPDGKRAVTVESRRLYALTELKGLLEKAGFEYRQSWGNYDGSAYGMDSPRLIALASRRRDEAPRHKDRDDGLPKAIRIKGRR